MNQSLKRNIHKLKKNYNQVRKKFKKIQLNPNQLKKINKAKLYKLQ